MKGKKTINKKEDGTDACDDYGTNSKSDHHMGKQTPKKRNLTKKGIESSVKKMKTKNSDSSFEVPCTVAHVSKSRSSGSEESPVNEEVSRSTSNSSGMERQREQNINNLLNWVLSEFTEEGSTAIAKAAPRQQKSPCKPKRIAPTFIRSLREDPVLSPVTTVVTNEEAVRKSDGDALDIHGRAFLPELFPVPKGGPRMPKKSSIEEKLLSKPEESPVLNGKRVNKKLSIPSKNIVITTAEVHNEEQRLKTPSVIKKDRHVVTSKSDHHMGKETPKKRPLTKKGIDTSVKKMKTKNSDSSFEVPCTVAHVSKSRSSGSEESPVNEEVSRSTSNSSGMERQREQNINNLLNWVFSEFTEEGSTAIAKEAPRQQKSPCKPKRRIAPTFIRSLREDPVLSPVTTVVTNEEAVRKSDGDAFDIHGRAFLPELFPVPKGGPRMPKEASIEEKLLSKTEESPVSKGRPRIPKEASIEEKSPTKLGHSPVTGGRFTTSIEAPSKPENSRVTSGRSGISVYYFRPLNFYSVPVESSVKRKRPRGTVKHFEPEECPSEPEVSPVPKGGPRMLKGILIEEKLPSKPEESPVPKERPRIPKEGSIQEKLLSKSEEFPVPKGRPRMPKEASIEENSPSKPEESSVSKGGPRIPKEASIEEKLLTKPEESPVLNGKRVNKKLSIPSKNIVITTAEVHNEEKQRLKTPSVIKKDRRVITSKSDHHMGRQTPKKRPLTKKGIESSVKKTKTKNSDSSFEVPCTVADVSKSRRHASVASFPLRESPQIYLSNVNKTLNTSVKRSQRHEESTSGNETLLYAKSAKQSLIAKNREIIDYSSDSSSEESSVNEEVSRSTSNSSGIERQMEQNINNLLNWILSEFTEGSTAIAGEAPRQQKSPCKPKRIAPTFIKSLRKEPVHSPVTTVVTNEEAVRESDGDALDIHGRTFLPELSPVPKGRPRIPKEASIEEKSASKPEESLVLKGRPKIPKKGSIQEKLLSKSEESPVLKGRPKMQKEASIEEKYPSEPEESPVSKGRPGILKEASIEEKSPTKPGHSPVRRGRSTTSIEAPSKPQHSRVTRERSKISAYNLRPLNSSLVPEESSVKRKRSRCAVEHFDPEECPSEPEQLPFKKGTKITSGFVQKKYASKVRKSRCENNNEGSLRINPSITKIHADSSVEMSQKHVYQTLSNVQVEYDSSKTSPVKRKSSMATYTIHKNHFEPEASFIESETSHKKITKGTGDLLNHSGQNKLSAKAKSSTNKSSAPVDNNEVLSDLGENSMPSVKRKENRMTFSGKYNRRSRSPPKRTISCTHDKESKDANSNENISEPANGVRRSSRFRVPPLDIWRNERLVFETLPSGEVKCSVDKGSEEDKFGLLQIAKKAERRIQLKKKKVQTVQNTPIVDPKTCETVHALLHRPFESLQWSMAPNEVERPPLYIAVKAFRSNSTSFGFVDISPLSIKKTQYSPRQFSFCSYEGAP
ncbi:hypothetical protein TNCV_4262821 [Trichonephila clavipes]|nr:hypothetical protein TNCV_4262821 [Trichonephila clavipes]